jgi:hypothetical protein
MPPTGALLEYNPANQPVQDVLSALLGVLKSNAPGLLLLALLSVFFSVMNFYTVLRAPGAGSPVSSKYLLVWVVANFILSLVILALILPSGMTLSSFDRTIFVYCVIATALPEVATNLRIQMGETARGIDLYKYKKQLSNLIANRVSVTDSLRQGQLFSYLTSYYFNQWDQFQERLIAFGRQDGLSENERAALRNLQEGLAGRCGQGDLASAFRFAREHEALIPKLLEYFAGDIDDYLLTAEAKLMRSLRYAHISIHEVKRLVGCGIVSPRLFFRRVARSRTRAAVSQECGIDERRLQDVYYNSRGAYRKHVRAIWIWTFGCAITAAAAAFLIVQIERNGNYLPKVGLIPPSSPIAQSQRLPPLAKALVPGTDMLGNTMGSQATGESHRGATTDPQSGTQASSGP